MGIDEGFSWRVIQFELVEMVLRVAADGHPPGYFVILKLWSAVVGDDLSALRLLSVLFAGCTGLILARLPSLTCDQDSWQTATVRRGRAFTTWTGLLAAAAVVSHRQFLWGATTARMYALGCLLAVLLAAALAMALRQPRRAWPYVLISLTAAAWMYTHHLAIVALAGIGCCAMALGLFRVLPTPIRWEFFWRLLLSGLGAAALYSPWLATLFRQSGEVYRDFWIPPLDSEAAKNTFLGWLTGIVPASPTESRLVLVSCGVLLACALGTAFRMRKPQGGRKRRLAALALLMFGAAVAPWAVCLVMTFALNRPLMQDRYFVFAYVSFVLFAWSAASLAGWPLPSVIFFVALIASNLTGAIMDIGGRPPKNAAEQAAVGIVARGAQPGDIVVADWPGQLNQLKYALRHFKRNEVRLYCYQPVAPPKGHIVHLAACELSEIYFSPDELPIRDSRVWVLSINDHQRRQFDNRTQLIHSTSVGEVEDRRYVALLQGVER